MMIDLLCVHRANQADIVSAGVQMRQQIGKFHATLPVTLERLRASPDLGRRFNKGKVQVFGYRLRKGLAFPFGH